MELRLIRSLVEVCLREEEKIGKTKNRLCFYFLVKKNTGWIIFE